MKYRKKPVVIEAIQLSNLSNQKIKECLEFMGQEVKSDEITQIKFQDYCDMVNDNGGMSIHTLEGVMNAPVGWFIIKGVKGEFYPCKPDIFEQTYEPVE